jgi:hypothetical protein
MHCIREFVPVHKNLKLPGENKNYSAEYLSFSAQKIFTLQIPV